MGVNSLPKTAARQRRGCDLNPGPSSPESSTLTTRLPSHPPTCSGPLHLLGRGCAYAHDIVARVRLQTLRPAAGRSCSLAGCTGRALKRRRRSWTARTSRSCSATSWTSRPTRTSSSSSCRRRTAYAPPSPASRATSCAGNDSAPSGNPTKSASFQRAYF